MNNSNFPFPKFPWTRSFITRVACISFHPSRNFPDPRKRYNIFVGRSFWRLVMFVYASSVNNTNIAAAGNVNKTAQGPEVNAKETTAPPAKTTPAAPVDNKSGNKSKSTPTNATTNNSGNKKGKKKGNVSVKIGGAKTAASAAVATEDPFDAVPSNSEKILKESSPFDLDYTADDPISTAQINEFSLTQSPNNALITGIRGCGKSHLMMTAAAFLTARNMSDLYRIICIGDCRAWAQSDNPVAFFSLEMMMAFRTAAERNASFNPNPNTNHHHSSQHQNTIEEGNYTPPGIFTSFDDLKSWMEAVGKRLKILEDLKLVIFIDQLEELYPTTNASLTGNTKMAARIFELLISLKYPVLITSIIPSPHVRTAMPSALKDAAQFAEMRMPAVLTYSDFDMFVEVFEASRKFTNDDDPLMHDLRMWTGGVPAQIAKFFTSSAATANNATTLNVATRLVRYRAERSKAFSELVLSAAAKMERLPRMHFLLQLCRMILHIPSDDPQLSPGAAINGLESLFLPAALQKFYHPEEGIVAYRHIPTAVSPAAYYALCDRKLLTKLAAKWEQVLEAVLASTMNSPNVCDESKRRIIRFYAQFNLFGISFDEELTTVSAGAKPTTSVTPSATATPATTTATPANKTTPTAATTESNIPAEMCFSGTNQFKDRVTFSLPTKKVRRVIFAGLSPTPILIPSGKYSPNLTCPLVFIPGRTDFCFYDLFVAIPGEKILYAITTCPFETMMGPTNASNNNNSNGSGGNSSTFNTATNAPLTPFTLLEMWGKDLKDAGYNKFTIKPVYIPPNELLAQVKY